MFRLAIMALLMTIPSNSYGDNHSHSKGVEITLKRGGDDDVRWYC